MEIYLDANATTALSPTACRALFDLLEGGVFNPSSAHGAGAKAREILERARSSIASALGDVDFENVIFTSGGTEGNNIVIGGFSSLPNVRILFSAVEHASVALPARAAGGVMIDVDSRGIVDVEGLLSLLSDVPLETRTLVCIQAANSETGILQPLGEIATELRKSREGVYLLVDAAQAFGRTTFDASAFDAVTFSGHKLHAPLGTGFVYLSDRLREILPAWTLGGGQEHGVRPGTQNVPGAAALAAAVNERMSNFSWAVARLATLRNMLENGVLSSVPGTYVVGAKSPRVPNTTNICFPSQDAQSLMARLDTDGVMCSIGSACSSARPEASPVLKAMGMSERQASRCLRFSVSIMNSEEEIKEAIRIIARCAENGTAA